MTFLAPAPLLRTTSSYSPQPQHTHTRVCAHREWMQKHHSGERDAAPPTLVPSRVSFLLGRTRLWGDGRRRCVAARSARRHVCSALWFWMKSKIKWATSTVALNGEMRRFTPAFPPRRGGEGGRLHGRVSGWRCDRHLRIVSAGGGHFNEFYYGPSTQQFFACALEADTFSSRAEWRCSWPGHRP